MRDRRWNGALFDDEERGRRHGPCVNVDAHARQRGQSGAITLAIKKGTDETATRAELLEQRRRIPGKMRVIAARSLLLASTMSMDDIAAARRITARHAEFPKLKERRSYKGRYGV
ncbi:MAG: hypothetical protein NVSMB31_21010 [Vulcanimicrobiaceae bacterium]